MIDDSELDGSQIIIRKADLSDKVDLFAWRNHPEARHNSFNTKKIEWREHEDWFEVKNKDLNTSIYIACLGPDKIGSVRFEQKEDIVAVSVILNPGFWGRKLSAKVIRLGTEKYIVEKGFNKKIVAEIKTANIISVRSFKKAGFKEDFITYKFDPHENSNP